MAKQTRPSLAIWGSVGVRGYEVYSAGKRAEEAGAEFMDYAILEATGIRSGTALGVGDYAKNIPMKAVKTVGYPLIGAWIHKQASKMGINRAMAEAGLPFNI